MASRRPKSVPPETNVYSVKKERNNKTFRDSQKISLATGDVLIKKDQASCGNKEIQSKTTEKRSEKLVGSKSARLNRGTVKKSGKHFDFQNLQKKVTSFQHFFGRFYVPNVHFVRNDIPLDRILRECNNIVGISIN